MTQQYRLLIIMAALLVFWVAPISAQQDGPGEGGVIRVPNTSGDPSTFNPIISSDASSSAVHSWMYPSIIGLDPDTLEELPMVPGALAANWEYDESGTRVTVYLRDDLQWSDGTPITAGDYLYAFNAIKTGRTASPRTYVFYELEDGTKSGGFIFDAQQIDDYTIEFTLGSAVENEEGELEEIVPNCVAQSDLNDIPVVPAHIFEEAFGDDYESMSDDPYFVAQATFGVFTDPFFEPGVAVSMVADAGYPDAELGYVRPGEWVYQIVSDTNVAFQRFKNGEFTYMNVPSPEQNETRESGEFQLFEYSSNGYNYMGYNLADPSNPQNGRAEDGSLIDQGLHPIFSDPLVRQAIAHAVDVDAMIGSAPDPETGSPATGIFEGNASRVVVHNHPASWVDPGLEPYAYDPEIAASLLEEAGWVDSDGDGVRECQDCLYAREVDAEFNGSPLEFELLTGAGSAVGELVAQAIKEYLENDAVGFVVDFQAIEFSTMLEQMSAQTYDAVLLAWNLGLPFDPDASPLIGIDADRVGSGFNAGSYQNPDLEALWDQAISVPGCDAEQRAELYREAMQMLYQDPPYLWISYGNTMVAAQQNVDNFEPKEYAPSWNIDSWAIIEE